MDNSQREGRRPLVGIIIGSFHTDFSRHIVQTVGAALRGAGMDVCLFLGLDASRFLKLEDYVDDGFDLHYYSQFEYSRFLCPDYLILSYGTISAVPYRVSLEAFLSRMPKVPVILLEHDADLPVGACVTVDNHAGMVSCVEHLILDHGCRKLLFLSGPEGNHDADLRLQAFRDAMSAHGLPVPESAVAYGNFSDRVDRQIEELLAACPRPDALICGNDAMAECAYRVLRRHGLEPGRDVAVTGFDDNPSAQLLDPPLTTVRQDAQELAENLVALIEAFRRGEQPASVCLPARLVRRGSCGCGAARSTAEERSKADRRSAITELRLQSKRMIQENMLTNLMLRNLMQENVSDASFFRKLSELLRALGTARSWVALPDKPLTVDGSARMFVPETLRLRLMQDGGTVRSWPREEAPVLRSGVRLASLGGDRPVDKAVAVFPLFSGSVHYGMMAVELEWEKTLFYYSLSLEIGTGLRYLSMSIQEQIHRQRLEEQNQILDYSASHDALTGLFNRTGLLNQIYRWLRKRGTGEGYLAVMADLDHLKQINDRFGHSAGDQAISAAAELLRGALPPDCPLGRSGGDEFTAFLPDGDGSAAARFQAALRSGMREYNAYSGLPYYVELSAGCRGFQYVRGMDLPLVLHEADEALYASKRSRRASVLRESGEDKADSIK